MLKLNKKFAELIANELKEELKKDEKPFYLRRPYIYVEVIILGAAGSVAAHFILQMLL